MTAGVSINYTATAYDTSGNSLDISLGTIWNINAQADGSWLGNVYSTAKAGLWNVSALIGSYSSMAFLNVSHAAPIDVVLLPENTSVIAGQDQVFNATANDVYGNAWTVTNSAIFTIDSGAAGSWSSNIYTAAKAGAWTVTGKVGSLSCTASLNVSHGE